MTIKTIYHSYHFDISKTEEKEAWEELKKKLADYPCCMKSINPQGELHYHPERDGTVVPLETKFLFNNQWNTGPIPKWSKENTSGFRLFDWSLDVLQNEYIIQGYYLDQTDEMREIRRNTRKCRYCGEQEPAANCYVFCSRCIGSNFLKEKDLFLTRMLPVDNTDSPEPLTDAEKAYLLPLYKIAQLHNDKKTIKKLRAKIRQEYEQKIKRAKDEHDGMLWLIDHNINLSNVIYYDHVGRFCFGWRTPLSQTLLSELLDIIKEFHWPYEIKTADERVLFGNLGEQ